MFKRMLASNYRAADFLFALAPVALTTLVLLPMQPRLTVEVVALLYLVPVMVSAWRWGLLPSFAASLASFLTFNYFFIAPTHTLAVSNPQELLALVIFLIVAVLISQAVGAAKLGAALASAREMEATTLYSLTQALSSQAGLDETLASVARLVAEAFGLSGCEILLSAPDGRLEPRAASGATGQRAVEIPLAANQAQVGLLRLTTGQAGANLEPTAMQVLTTFAAQLGLFVERVRLAQAAERARVLEASDELKSALLSSVSHDLRTPLSAIKASATVLLQQDVALDAAARYDLLSAINEETDRLNRLVGDLLDMSRIEAGALQPRRQWNLLSDIVESARARLRRAAEQHTLQIDVPDDLPLVPVDTTLMQQVFVNLLSNSLKFAPPHTIIRVSAKTADGETLHVQVSNQGPPVAEKDLEHIFDKFYRVTAADRVTGTGLGLSICKGIVEAHGGRIWAANLSSGLAFNFTLPLIWEGSRHPAVPPPEEAP